MCIWYLPTLYQRFEKFFHFKIPYTFKAHQVVIIIYNYACIPVFPWQMSICLCFPTLFYALTMYLPNFCACSHIFPSIYTCVLLSIQEKMLTQISMTQVYYYILSYMHACKYFFNYCTQSDLNKVFYCSLTSPEISKSILYLINS